MKLPYVSSLAALCAGSLALGLSALPAQDAVNVDAPEPVSGLAAFEADYGSGWKIWNGPDGLPYRVFGPGADVLPEGIVDFETAERAADIILRKHSAWLGIRGQDRVEIADRVRSGDLIQLRYRQLHRGIPVEDGQLEFVFHTVDGRLSMLGSEAVTGLDIDTKTTLDKEAALARYRQLTSWSEKLGSLTLAPKLEITNPREEAARLAYRISAVFDDRPEAWTLWIDAKTGDEIRRQSEIFECMCGETHAPNAHLPLPPAPLRGNVKGLVSPPKRGVTNANPPAAAPMAGVRVSVSGVGTTFTDANGDFSLPYTGSAKVPVTITLSSGRYWNSMRDDTNTPVLSVTGTLDPAKSTNFVFNATPSEYRTAQANTAKYMMDMHDYAKRLVPTMPIDSSIGLRVNINSSCNAYYNGSRINFYRQRGSCNNTASAAVIAHEYGHHIDNRNGGIGRTPRTPSEGVADVCSLYLVDDPIVGRDFRTNGGGVRSALNSLTHPLTGSSQAVHTFGQPFMGWTWDFLVAMRARFGNVAGKRFAEKPIFESIALNGRDMLDYILKVYLADDDDSNLNNGTPHISSLSRASWKRHFVRDTFHNIAFTHTAMKDVTNGSAGFTIQTDVRAKRGTVSRATLLYRINNGSTVRVTMTKSGSSTWSGKIPAVTAPGVVSYQFEATSSLGDFFRYPQESGDGIVFAVGRKTSAFADSFETATGSFTASNGSSSNGWSRVVPFGRNYDPPSAATGRYVWALNRSTREERYAVGSGTRQLTSRGIDCSKLKGTRLRFRRWITGDSRSSTRLYVNNNLINTMSRTNDQAWRTVDLDISSIADGLSNVVVRFDFTWSNTSRTDHTTGGPTIDDVQVYGLEAGSPGSFVAFGTSCTGGGKTPKMTNQGVPSVGSSYGLVLSGAKASAPTLLLTGASKTKWNTVSLPIALAGTSGCFLRVSPDIIFGAAANASGALTLTVPIPNDTNLRGVVVHQQMITVDPAANSLGLVTTNGGTATIGG